MLVKLVSATVVVHVVFAYRPMVQARVVVLVDVVVWLVIAIIILKIFFSTKLQTT